MDAVSTPNLESFARCLTYLHAYDSISDAKSGLGKYFTKYNQHRPHSALDDKTPDEFYFDNLPALLKAA